jgi:hypothetical protein
MCTWIVDVGFEVQAILDFTFAFRSGCEESEGHGLSFLA